MIKIGENGYPVFYEREGYMRSQKDPASFINEYWSAPGTIEIHHSMIIGRIILKTDFNRLIELGTDNKEVKLEDGYLLLDYSNSSGEGPSLYIKEVKIDSKNPFINFIKIKELSNEQKEELLSSNKEELREYAKKARDYYEVAKALDEQYSIEEEKSFNEIKKYLKTASHKTSKYIK